jgi:hypothetical protein
MADDSARLARGNRGRSRLTYQRGRWLRRQSKAICELCTAPPHTTLRETVTVAARYRVAQYPKRLGRLAGIVPGFKEHLGRVENRSRGSGPDAPPREAVQGEGDYRAAREYRRDVERFVASADIERAVREAAPRDEAEAAELEAAMQQGRRGNPRSERTGPGPPHR